MQQCIEMERSLLTCDSPLACIHKLYNACDTLNTLTLHRGYHKTEDHVLRTRLLLPSGRESDPQREHVINYHSCVISDTIGEPHSVRSAESRNVAPTTTTWVSLIKGHGESLLGNTNTTAMTCVTMDLVWF